MQSFYTIFHAKISANFSAQFLGNISRENFSGNFGENFSGISGEFCELVTVRGERREDRERRLLRLTLSSRNAISGRKNEAICREPNPSLNSVFHEMSANLWKPRVSRKFAPSEAAIPVSRDSNRDSEIPCIMDQHANKQSARMGTTSDDWTKELLFLYSEFVSA